ncbi:hypothetical protein [Neorhizobium sp. JUb45]|uniref:hypothetical protein n=1 Tax=Neorhizobium sp. JUb45 TaxID=2485113 RepID=UPI001052BB4D|nr:hypothetical protein [Neorhizobium sp. JUb45]TCQ99157.1 hypothetical protein EDF70_110145 [Neorhizobium sp. JUb45]
MGKILFVGGSGVVGQQMVRAFRDRHPEPPILIGGRDVGKADVIARDVGYADAVEVDTQRKRLGLHPDTPISAVVMLAPDSGLHGMRLAQDLQIPYMSIGNWLIEVGAEMAHFISRPDASPVVLSSHWHGGPTVFLAMASVEGLDVVHSIKVGAIIDDLDPTGPAAQEDMEVGAEGVSNVLGFQNGRRVWLRGKTARREIAAVDGRIFSASAFAPYDIVSLHAATGAREVRFDLASGVSSSRVRGGDVGTEVILEIEGEINGQLTRRRSTIEFTKGQAKLTGLSAALSLSIVLGLEGRPAFPPGLYFPEQLMDHNWFLPELVKAGATVNVDLNPRRH